MYHTPAPSIKLKKVVIALMLYRVVIESDRIVEINIIRYQYQGYLSE